MTLGLLYQPQSDADEGEESFWAAVRHFRAKWPGTHLLLICPESVWSGTVDLGLDGVSLPGEAWGSARVDLTDRLLATIVHRYDIVALIGFGQGVTDLGDRLDLDLNRYLLAPSGSKRLGSHSKWSVFGPGTTEELLAQIEARLSAEVPVELILGPETSWESFLEMVDSHRGLGTAERILVHWRDRPSALLPLVLSELTLRSSAEVEIRILASEYFDVPRAGLTHTPGEFLFQPSAWRQMAAFGRLVLTAPTQVGFRVRTISRRRWIKAAVGLANLGLGACRATLRPLARGR